MSYGALDTASSSIASALRGMGVVEGDRVAVCLRKSAESVISIFGILKAGAVFVPLDRSSPVARLASIARDCSPAALIGSGRKLREILETLGAAAPPVVEVAEGAGAAGAGVSVTTGFTLVEAVADRVKRVGRLDWAGALAASPMPALSGRGGGDLAFILYTSGSTGVPKGVMISHENALAFTSWARRRFAVAPGDRVASVAPFHFDLSTFDLYSTIEGGGTVVLISEDVTLFPASLAASMESRRVTMAYLVPSVITRMLMRGDLAAKKLEALRLVLFAGEVFPPRYLSMLMAAFPNLSLFNLYGPTETNVCAAYEVKAEDRLRREPVPIGAAASGDSLFALGETGALVTRTGEMGELYAAGPTVALGYWGDPKKSAEVFLPSHPQGPPGKRVCRTGDQVTLDAAGNWLYHGRRDHMVKSRGYRIELGDIETALLSHDAVEEAAAVPIPDEEVGHRLKACVVLRTGAAATEAGLKEHCAARLPRYMIPESVEFFGALPKTSSGKIDRQRLIRG